MMLGALLLTAAAIGAAVALRWAEKAQSEREKVLKDYWIERANLQIDAAHEHNRKCARDAEFRENKWRQEVAVLRAELGKMKGETPWNE